MIDDLLKYLPSLTGFAKRSLNNNQQDAEDAIQDLGIRMWGKKDFLNTIPLEEQKKYAVTSLVNICTDYHRKFKAYSNPRKKGNQDELKESAYSKMDDLDIEQMLVDKENDTALYNAIMSIKKEKHREMILMFLNGYKCKDIQEIYQTSINNVTGGLRYARLAIMRNLKNNK